MNMFHWSVSMLRRFLNPDGGLFLFAASMSVASLNMLIQILFSMAFGDKEIPKLGGKR